MTRTQQILPTGLTVEQLAQIVHETTRAIQTVTGDPSVSLPWDDAPQNQRDGTVASVQLALDGIGPEDLFRSWVATKTAAGWVYGPLKDAVAKTHPCLVEHYHQLPPAQQFKDAVFVAVARAAAGLR